MTLETNGLLREDFRHRALACELVAAVLATLVAWRAAVDAPTFFTRWTTARGFWTLQTATAIFALVTVVSLWRRHFRTARVTVVGQVVCVLAGWGWAMDRHLLLPGMPLDVAGARPEVLAALLPALACGALLLVPSLVYLFRLFRTR